MPSFLAYFMVTLERPVSQWLRSAGTGDNGKLGAEQWAQTTNIGFQVASTILSMRKMMQSPALIIHHVVTILGCASLLHRKHCVGYGAMFTAFTETGSTFHNIMTLWNVAATRWLRVFTDVVTRGGGLLLILLSAPVDRARGLPLALQIWSYFGGVAWFGLNSMWTKQVFLSLVRKKPLK